MSSSKHTFRINNEIQVKRATLIMRMRGVHQAEHVFDLFAQLHAAIAEIFALMGLRHTTIQLVADTPANFCHQGPKLANRKKPSDRRNLFIAMKYPSAYSMEKGASCTHTSTAFANRS